MLVAIVLEIDLKYGNQFREQERQMQVMQKNTELMQKINANATMDVQALNGFAENKSIRSTYDFLDTIYSGLVAAHKRKVSVRTYFIEQGKACRLKETLRNFVAQIQSRLPAGQSIQTKELLTLDSINSKGQKISWEDYYFGHVTLPLARKRLSRIKGEMVLLELENRR